MYCLFELTLKVVSGVRLWHGGPIRLCPPLRAGVPACLESWKEIAACLNRTIRTAQRWEAEEGFPVHRLRHGKGDSVFALTDELGSWLDRRRGVKQKTTFNASARPLAKKRPSPRFVPWLRVSVSIAALVSTSVPAWSLWRYSRIQWALREAVPEIRTLTQAGRL